MRRLAGVFSALVLLALIGVAALAIWLRPAPPPLPALTRPIDRIVVEKSARRMVVYANGQALRSYGVALGFAPVGDKTRQGDGRTPEGLYRIDRRNADSAYHLSLGINYPRPQDRARAAKAGNDPGGDIFFHGQPNSLPDAAQLRGDWTAGCIALSNAEMRELWPLIGIGTEVEIRP